MHAFDRRTNGWTDISLVDKTALHPMQRGNNTPTCPRKQKNQKNGTCNVLQLEAARRRTSRSRLFWLGR